MFQVIFSTNNCYFSNYSEESKLDNEAAVCNSGGINVILSMGAMKIFQLKRDRVIRGRKLHNEELHNMHSSQNIIRIIKSRRMRWAGHVARMETKGNAHSICLGMPEGKRPLGIPRRMWEVNIKMDLREIGWGGMYWIDLAQDRRKWRALVNMVMKLRVPQNGGKFLSSCATRGFSRRAQFHGVSWCGGTISTARPRIFWIEE
jgi:hypothetical protein